MPTIFLIRKQINFPIDEYIILIFVSVYIFGNIYCLLISKKFTVDSLESVTT